MDSIDRQAVLQAIDRVLNPCTDMAMCMTLSHLKEDIERLPAVEPERPKGHWIDRFAGEYRCSNCQAIIGETDITDTPINSFKYCPFCGARMEKNP